MLLGCLRAPASVLAVLALGSVAIMTASAQTRSHVRFELAPAGNEARYRVREQFLNVNFPNDAVGTTSAIKGAIVIDATGALVPSESRFVVDLRTLKSDSENRDRIIQERTLQTAQFPNIELTLKELRGLRYPWAVAGELTFQIVGDLTIHGVRKPSTWQVTARAKDGGLAGRATTAFTFGDFGMTVPTSFRLLSVEDNVRLEYDFHLVRSQS